MIATHNIKVNGQWYRAGEEYAVSEPDVAEASETQPEDVPSEEQPESGVAAEAEPVKVKRTPSRRKASN